MSIEKIPNLTTDINDTPYIKAFDEFRNSREYNTIIDGFLVSIIIFGQFDSHSIDLEFRVQGKPINTINKRLNTKNKRRPREAGKYNFLVADNSIKDQLNKIISTISSKITSDTKGVITDSDKELINKKVYMDIMMSPFYSKLFKSKIQRSEKEGSLDFFKTTLILPLSKSIIKNLFGDYDSIESIDELQKIVKILKDIQKELKKEKINENRLDDPVNHQLNDKYFNTCKKMLDNFLEAIIKEIHTLIGKQKEEKAEIFGALTRSQTYKQSPNTTLPPSENPSQPQQTLTQKEITREEVIQKEVNDVLNKLNIEKSVYENINKNGNYDSFLNILKQTKELFNKYKDNINENRKAEILEKLKSSRSNLIQQRDSLQKSHNQQNANIRISNSHIHNKAHKTNELKDDDMYRRNISRIDTLSADIKYLINIIDNKDK